MTTKNNPTRNPIETILALVAGLRSSAEDISTYCLAVTKNPLATQADKSDALLMMYAMTAVTGAVRYAEEAAIVRVDLANEREDGAPSAPKAPSAGGMTN